MPGRTLSRLEHTRGWSYVWSSPITQPVHRAPQAPPPSQAGLVAPGSVDKGMICPLACQNSTRNVPLQESMVPEAGGGADTTTLAVNASNRALGLHTAASCPGLEV